MILVVSDCSGQAQLAVPEPLTRIRPDRFRRRRYLAESYWPMHTPVMTVTYRSATVGDSSGGGGRSSSGAGLSISGRCADCSTDFAVMSESAEVLVIDVRGQTCGGCNPGAEPVIGASPGGGDGLDRIVKVWWASSNDTGSRWRVLDLNRVEGTASYGPDEVPEKVQDQARARAVNTAWSQRLAGMLSAQFGNESWQAVDQAWQPGHCGIFAALATIIDQVWGQVVPSAVDGTRVVVRLVGLPPVVAALLPVAVTRSLNSGEFQFTQIADVLRALGPTVCVGTGYTAICDAVRRELGDLSTVPTAEALDRLSAAKIIHALGYDDDLPTIAELLAPSFVCMSAPVTVPTELGRGLLGSQQRIESRGTAPVAPSRFGTS